MDIGSPRMVGWVGRSPTQPYHPLACNALLPSSRFLVLAQRASLEHCLGACGTLGSKQCSSCQAVLEPFRALSTAGSHTAQ